MASSRPDIDERRRSSRLPVFVAASLSIVLATVLFSIAVPGQGQSRRRSTTRTRALVTAGTLQSSEDVLQAGEDARISWAESIRHDDDSGSVFDSIYDTSNYDAYDNLEGETIKCILSRFEYMFADNVVSSKHDPVCTLLLPTGAESDQSYNLLLDVVSRSNWLTLLSQEGDLVVSINDALVSKDEGVIRLSDTSRIEVQNSATRQRSRRRNLAATTGRLTVLGILVTVGSSKPMYTTDQLYSILYQDTVSLKRQYRRCSFDKLRVEPSGLGVISVTVSSNPNGKPQAIVNAASEEALDMVQRATGQTYEGLRNYADLIMYITPDMGNWIAYASVGGGTSVYNDKWGGFIASMMHETGHNLELLHAAEGPDPYKDYTGYMGGAIISYHDKVGFPEMCFNAQNHWKLKWFEDRAKSTSLYEPTMVKLAAFVDYEKTTENVHYVVIRSGNVYMHYNRAKEANLDTTEYKDHLTIYQETKDGTNLFAALSYPDKPLYEKTFPNLGTWRAKICNEVRGNQYEPDYLTISIGFGDSKC